MSHTLETIQELGNQLVCTNAGIKEAEEQLSKLKAIRRKLEEDSLPTLMDELGIQEILLADGTKITCRDFVQAKVKDETTAYEWLRKTNNQGIIKNEIKVTLDRGEDDRAESVKEKLSALGVQFDYKQTIHPATLKSFITEILNDNTLRDSLPREAFGVFESRKVTFK